MTRARIIIALILAASLLGIAICAHAQQGSWNIPRSAYSTVRSPEPPVKVCPDERIATIAQARAVESKACP